MFTMFIRSCLPYFVVYNYDYTCFPVYLCFLVFYRSLLVLTYVYHGLTVLVFIMFTHDYSCLPMVTLVFQCSLVFTCLPKFFRAHNLCLPMFSWIHLSLYLYTLVYPFLLVFTSLYLCLPMFTRVQLFTTADSCLCLPLFSPVSFTVFTQVYS